MSRPGVRWRWLIAASVVLAAFAVAAVAVGWYIRAWLGDVWDNVAVVQLEFLNDAF